VHERDRDPTHPPGRRAAGAPRPAIAALHTGAPLARLGPADVLALQRAAGNGAVGRLIARLRAAPQVRAVQRLKEIGPADNWSKISDDESLALPMASNLGGQRLYGDHATHPTMLDAANLALAAAGSPLTLAWHADTASIRHQEYAQSYRRSGKVQVRAAYRSKQFTRIEPVHSAHGRDTAMTLLRDCGKNTRELMGAVTRRARYTDAGGTARQVSAATPILALADVVRAHVTDGGVRGTLDGHVATYRHTPDAANYRALDQFLAATIPTLPAGWETAAGVNQHARPAVGQGFAIIGAGDKHPHAARKWKFHMAPVVLTSVNGVDYVTLENFNVPGPAPDRNTSWTFNMYGSVTHTIHEEQALARDAGGHDVGEFGTRPTTVVVSG
jgi:hypothetical protein